MRLGHNRLTGPIPGHFQFLTSLQILYLDNNLLTGKLDEYQGHSWAISKTFLAFIVFYKFQWLSFLGLLQQLELFDVTTNRLTGTLPKAFHTLPSLAFFRLSFNQLHGSIPIEYYEMTKLSDLQLRYNQLTGSISSSIGALTKLETLTLDHNQFHGMYFVVSAILYVLSHHTL